MEKQACQTRDWPLHKRECSALQKWAASAPQGTSDGGGEGTGPIVASDAIRCLGRILWRRQKRGRDSVWVSFSFFRHEFWLTLGITGERNERSAVS
jgi:hypothetical protein